VVVVLVVVLGFLTTFIAFLLDYAALGALAIFLVPLQRFVGMHSQGPSGEGRGVGRTWASLGVGLVLGSAVGPVVFTALGFKVDVAISAILFGGATLTSAIAPWWSAQLPRVPVDVSPRLRAVVSLPFARVSLLVVAGFVVLSFPANYLPYYAVTFYGVSQAETGYILGAARLVSLLTAFFLGSWGDRRGHPEAVLVSFFLLAAGIAGTWLASDSIGMTAATLVMFAGGGWLGASLLPLALAPIPTQLRGSAIGLYGSMEDLGLLLGPVLFGLAWSYWGGRTLFPVALVAALIGLVLTLPYVLQARRRWSV
jgi:predicted MFS family arabinose efflux permease